MQYLASPSEKRMKGKKKKKKKHFGRFAAFRFGDAFSFLIYAVF